jgi:aspartyl-tRNA(Asn)/glutamyl-tRNA(Gln) amidotransferase subunit A
VSGNLREGELETAAEMAAALSAREVKAVELLERSLRRLEAWQPFINAFSQVWANGAREQAGACDSSHSTVDRPSSAGVPLAIKDLYDVLGLETTGCCAAYRGRMASKDSPMVSRARQEGLVFVGKTNQHELAAGGTNLVSACGRTGNPWDPARMTGGSSGGSGAAVAAGIVPWAFGSDTGGSIRIPASMCGTFGLKPTTGRLSIEGLMPLGPSLDCPGPMAATAGDLRLLAEVMATRPLVAESTARSFRIGVPDGFFAQVHEATAGVVQQTAHRLEGLGMEVDTVDGHGIEEARRLWMDVVTPEFSEAHPLLKDPARRALVAPQVVEWLERGERLTAEQRELARQRRTEIGVWFRSRLKGFDALLIPTTPYPPPPPDVEDIELMGAGRVSLSDVGPGWISCSINLAGLPAVNLPAGRSTEGLPIGVSLVGAEGDDRLLLHLASTWEEGTGYRPRLPMMPGKPT